MKENLCGDKEQYDEVLRSPKKDLIADSYLFFVHFDLDLFNGSERGHCASNTSARRDVTIDDVIIRTPDVMCEWLTRRTTYIPNFICLACKLIAL